MFSREELLGGLPARRASTALFAIEGETARLVAASRINRAAFIGERTAAEREQAFLAALASGGELPRPPTIADLERFAPDWAGLAPQGTDARAAIARHLGSKYRFRQRDVPQIRAVVGLDDPAVAAAFERLHHAPLDTIYAPRLPLGVWLRWRLAAITARFDRLSPFWIAYFLALTETLGEGIMSVPLALAGLGPLPGVVLLIVLGVVNLITMGALTEAIIRNGSMRYGTAYFSRFVRELLGRVPTATMSLALGLFNILTFFVYFLGFGSVLTGATGIPLGVWIALLFGVNIFVLRKETLDDTIASAVLIGLANLLLVVAITLIAVVNIEPANLAYTDVPILNGRPIDPTIVGLVLGIVLVAFFGHTSAANASKLVLTLEPSGRSLLWGNLAALATIIALYCAATVAILGALGPEPLVGTRGTSITPLANELGPLVNVLGSVYVLLAIGIGSLYVTLGLYNQVIELLPRPTTGGGRLGRLASSRRGRLIVGFAPAAAVCIALEVIVLAGQDNFAGPIGIGGVLAVPLITGVFPMLLILAARRKSEYVPGRIIGLIGHPVTVVALLGLFVLAVAAHGLLIWDGPIERVAALLVTAVAIGLIAWVWRGGAFRSRAVVELRIDRRQRRTTLSVTAAGRALVTDAAVDGGGREVRGSAALPAGAWRELRIWPHMVTADGWSVGLPADVEVDGEGTSARRHIDPSPDPVVITIDGRPATVRLQLEAATGETA